MTCKQPSVSTADNRLTSTARRTIRCTPSAKATVTTAGKPSGIAATARLTELMNKLNREILRKRPKPKMAMIMKKQSHNRRDPT